MKPVNVNDTNADEQIRSHALTLLDFGAVWCPPCRTLLPILDELGEAYGSSLSILKLDCDESPETAAAYGVMSMPTVILFKNGEPVEKLVGLRSKAGYQAIIDRYLPAAAGSTPANG
ncbi:thioredoxin family protein [Paenibacillus mucilaginosus]|uniref:Thioredoxin n=2 Tax=Paenibacillus mucilaginosus TaxID=61624 RepID=H6NI75_9BACL|nr:thioredoxin domain-containing protein [Paenibacillus mucilaginosus]AEI43878.1 thioredoxin [Paenibacillus mucilaginosus KNP414]AFC31478.1 thioredoxin [Paenibacillus mucilaginosus 3016]MCG7212613.1 thioredoxin family protein [Paenibacillus mucilaginosus]WDM25363.1 thioredoxin fold domain-containing protein [Paenibacillus mucilaginosus]WFA20022.1 thiol reductase thioredoxin [Paenibacillus mucilaginosus]